MSDPNEKDFKTLHRLECFLVENLDAEINHLSIDEVTRRLKAIQFDTSDVMRRTKEVILRARDRENRAQARKRIAHVQELARNAVDTVQTSLGQFRERLKAACQQDPSLALQFRAFGELEDPAELERALVLLDRLQKEQKDKADG